MRTITVAYGPEDLMEFAKAHLAPHAWQAIDDSINQIHHCLVHGLTSESQCLKDVLSTLEAVRKRLDE